MSDFEALQPHQLSDLSDQELLDHIHAARRAGDTEAERAAVGYLAFAFEPTIRIWVRRKTPDEHVDDVVMEVLASVIHASFDGKILGEFGSFLRRITQRRVADHFRREERRIDAGPLGGEHEGSDEIWSSEPGVADETGLVDLRDAVERVLARASPLHQRVLRLYGSEVDGFEDLPAEEVCSRIAADGSGDRMTVDNVAKIASRFRRDVREELDG